jgi:hypothetical protein
VNDLTFVTKDLRKVQIVFDWDDQVTIRSASGAKIGHLEHRQLDDDAPSEVRLIQNMYLEGADEGGSYKQQGVMSFVFATLVDKGYRLLARHHDGMKREDGSELTQDAPGFMDRMEAKGLVGRYNGP